MSGDVMNSRPAPPVSELPTVRRLGHYLVMALALLTCMALVEGYVLYSQTRQQEADDRLVTLCERQRTLLAQLRLAADGVRSAAEGEPAESARTGLRALLDDFLGNHVLLLHGDEEAGVRPPSPVVRDILTSKPFELNHHLRQFTGALTELLAATTPRETDAAHARVVELADGRMLGYSLDTLAAVWQGEREARLHTHRVTTMQWLAGVVGVLVLGTILLMEPAIRRLKGETAELQASNVRLHRALIELADSRGLLQKQQQAALSMLEDLEFQRQRLAREIEERTRVEDRLRESNEELGRRNDEMQQFIYTVSHDLKSPLLTLSGFVGMLREDLARGELESVGAEITRIEQATKKMNNLIHDLLELSRIGRVQSEPETIDTTLLVREVVEGLSEQVREAKAEVEVQPNMPPVVMDRVRLVQVFDNLVTNALKYGCNGTGGHVTIGGVQDGPRVRYFVRDRGPGIDPQFHDRIFQLFRRLHSDDRGTGVGLAIVAKIMQVCGGHCTVESEPGKGATFWVVLPTHAAGGTGRS